MFNKSFFVAIVVINIIALSGCSNLNTTTQKQTQKTTDAAVEHEAETQWHSSLIPSNDEYIKAVTDAIEKSGLSLTYPDNSEWTFGVSDGYMSISTMAKQGDNDCVVTAWADLTSTTLHYLDTKNGVIIDDGTIED